MPTDTAHEVRAQINAQDGTHIAYGLSRQGSPKDALLLLHGMASNMTRWTAFLTQTRLINDWDLVRLDLRGHGQSIFRGPIDTALWCQDLCALIDAEHIKRVVLVGHCMGANLAMNFAQLYPDRTKGLVLIEPMVPEALRGKLARALKFRHVLDLLARAVLQLNRWGLHRRAIKPLDLCVLDQATRAQMAQTQSGFPRERYAAPFEDLKHVSTAVYLQDLLAVTAELPQINPRAQPTLVLLSKGSHFTNPDQTRRWLHQHGFQEIIELDAEHWIPTEQPDAMRVTIEQWCDALT
jgi:pimeloyl-ACP methyl ester carboxylesterase